MSSCVCMHVHTCVAVFSFSQALGPTLPVGYLSLHESPASKGLGLTMFHRLWGGITNSSHPKLAERWSQNSDLIPDYPRDLPIPSSVCGPRAH